MHWNIYWINSFRMGECLSKSSTIIGIHRRGWMVVDRRGRENWVGLIAGVSFVIIEANIDCKNFIKGFFNFRERADWEWEKIEFVSQIHKKRIALTTLSIVLFIKGLLFVTHHFHLKWKKYHIRAYTLLRNFTRHCFQVIKPNLSIFRFLDVNYSLIQLKFCNISR